jgi:endonuclease/exonuclease/phosphatase family metal-dependent hydrolase
MSYNVLARGATAHQESYHKFSFSTRSTPETNLLKSPTQVEHIEQTLQRYAKIVQELSTQSPDIVLLQEVDNYFFSYVLKHLPNYNGYFKLFIPTDSAGVARGDLSSNFNTAVIWKKDVFEEVECKTLDSELYYASHPNAERPGATVAGKSIFANKNATLVRLKEKNAPEETFTVASVHLSGDTSKLNKATNEKKSLVGFVLEEIGKSPDKYKVIGGDLNCPVTEESCPSTDCCYKWIKDEMTNNNFTQIGQDTTVTTCDFDYSSVKHDKTVIDSIFYSEKLEDKGYALQSLSCKDDNTSSVYKQEGDIAFYADVEDGSDHAWILATLGKETSN